jgi:hypothetical protein
MPRSRYDCPPPKPVKMTKKAREALIASIVKYTRAIKRKEPYINGNLVGAGDSCQLCLCFPENCSICPIGRSTGLVLCEGTPYRYKGVLLADNADEALVSRAKMATFIKHATQMRDWMMDLLRVSDAKRGQV